ncbi:MAG: alpha/beta hydrolase family protein [Aquabacterium sp.]
MRARHSRLDPLIRLAAAALLLLATGLSAVAQDTRGDGRVESQRSFVDRPGAAGPAGAATPTPAVDPDVEVLELDWRDTERGRDVPVRLYWPIRTAGAMPLVVVSHGIGGSRRGYSWLGRHLARNGMVSLHVQHVGSDRSLWGGSPLALVGRLHGAAQDGEAIDRARDIRFALDRVLADPRLGPRLDTGRIAAAGHSYGANTVMLAIGAQVMRDGQPLALREPRLRAALLLSAPPFYGEDDLPAILGGVTLPTLHVTATEDVIRIPGYYSPARDRIQVFDAMGGRDKALAVFEGGSHSIFTDRAAPGGVELNARVKEATKGLALAFLRAVFDGADDAWRQWPAQHRTLLARWVHQGPGL